MIKALLCNSEYFGVVDSDVYFNNTGSKDICVYTATVVTRTLVNLSLYVYCRVITGVCLLCRTS